MCKINRSSTKFSVLYYLYEIVLATKKCANKNQNQICIKQCLSSEEKISHVRTKLYNLLSIAQISHFILYQTNQTTCQ